MHRVRAGVGMWRGVAYKLLNISIFLRRPDGDPGLDTEPGEGRMAKRLQQKLMKTNFLAARHFPRNQRAFTFIEVMVATGIALFLFISFYAALASGTGTIQIARENLRATQIMVSRMEGIRLFRWDQLTNTALLPTNFTESFYPGAGGGNQGFTYTGTIAIAPAALASPPSSYSTNMCQVTIRLDWQSSGPPHTRQMTTYCAKYGIQNYVWTSN